MVTEGRVAGRARELWIGVLCGYLAVVTAAPVATTPLRSDDIISQRRPQDYLDSGQTLWTFLLDWFGPWIRDQGRFFPGSAVWTFLVFTAFPSRFTYKIFVAGLVLVLIALAALTAATLSTSAAAPVAIAALAAGVHLRDFFDGVDSFSGILPFTIAATLACLVLLIRRRGWVVSTVVVLLWSTVLITYEVAILLVPTLCVLVYWSTRRWLRVLPILVPAVVVSAVVLVLRANVTDFVGNAYRINLEPGRVVVTYLRQAAGALPWSTQWFPGTEAQMSFDPGLLVLALVLVAAPVAILLTLVARQRVEVSGGGLGRLALLGASMWLLPPILVAVSLGWQNELPPGQAYVSVVWGYVGVAMLLVAGWLALARGEPPGRSVRGVARHLATAVIALAAAASVAQSVSVTALLFVNPH
ncbi:MAG TPA: hypothetical protein VFR40_12835 [Lapillicoccus sp.]|nr:hypothetical protein [Lapillicoccus sp.]